MHRHILFCEIRGKSSIGFLLLVFSLYSYSTRQILPLADFNRFSQFSHIFAEKLFRKKIKENFISSKQQVVGIKSVQSYNMP
jgi:hypothetical protein